MGPRPFPYIRRVLKACGQRKPPICDRTILDYLGLKVTEALPENAPPELHEAFRDCCSWLNRERKEIWVYPHRSRRSKRANKLHEATHFICPTHVEVNVFSCKETDTERPGYRRQEQEAFQGSSAFLMPLDTFIDNILSYPTSLKAIEELHDLYDAPLAVAAIWYAYANPGLCAVVMVEPNIAVPEGAGTPLEHSNGQLHFPLEIPLQPAQRSRISYAARSGKHVQLDGPRAIFPLRVRYSSHSARFPKFIKAGLGID